MKNTKQNKSTESVSVLGESEAQTPEEEVIYLDLDTILDTRLGTLAKMGDEHAVASLNSGKYHKRMIDEFVGVDSAAFKEAYANRDEETLKLSVLTNMTFFLRRLIKDSLAAAMLQQKVEKLRFVLNIHPYKFEDEEAIKMLIACLRFHTYSTSSVSVVSIPEEELTPEYCGANFQIMIRYDWLTWMDKHKAFFEKKGIPTMTLVVPELFMNAIPTPEEVEQLEMKKHNPFVMMETLAASMFRLKHMPISLFSIHEAITSTSAKSIVDRVTVTEEDIRAYLDKHHPEKVIVKEDPLPEVDLSQSYDLL